MQTDDQKIPQPPDIPEPPPGSVVLDHDGDPWRRYESGWCGTDSDRFAQPWTTLGERAGPLTVVYTPDPDVLTAEPPDPTCTGCGLPIHRVHGMWIDDLGRGHCPSGAKQGRNSHTTAATRYVLHATSVMTAIRDGRLILSLAGPAGSVDVELHDADRLALTHDLMERAAAQPIDDDVWASTLAGLSGEKAAVYAVEDRDAAGVGPWHRHDQTVYPTVEAAQAAVERDYGAVVWDDDLSARMPGTSTAWWRIVELALAGTQGGAR